MASRCSLLVALSKVTTAQSISPFEKSPPRSPATQTFVPSRVTPPKEPLLTLKAVLNRQSCPPAQGPLCPPTGPGLKAHWQNIGQEQASMMVGFMCHAGEPAAGAGVPATASTDENTTAAAPKTTLLMAESSLPRQDPR